MHRKTFLIAAGIALLSLAAAVALILPRLAEKYIRQTIAAAAKSRGMRLVDADVSVSLARIEIRKLHLEAPGFSLRIRKTVLPDWRLRNWADPRVDVHAIHMEGITAEGEIPESLLSPKTRTDTISSSRLNWQELEIRGISLDIQTHGVTLVTQDGNYRFLRGQGSWDFSGIQVRSEHLPVYFIDTAELETQGFSRLTRMTLSGLVWSFSKEFEFYASKATLLPEDGERLAFIVEGRVLPDRGSLRASGTYDRKTGRIASLMQVQEAWVGLAIPENLPVTGRENVRFSGKVELTREAGISEIAADGRLWGLTVSDPRIAPEPLSGLDFDFRLTARHDAASHELEIPSATLRSGKLLAQATARIALHPETRKPRIQLALNIPPLPCQEALQALPPALVPNLRQLKLEGTFQGRIGLDVDMNRIHQEDARLSGKIDLDACRVRSAPPHLRAERLLGDFAFTVTEPGGQRITVEVAQDNESFRPLEEISPAMVSAVLTTEDASFWRHHGFITSEFATALTRNLRAGHFRYGASSITMQIVKNVFFERRKTLSRKFEELFYTWYVEKVVPKPRLMEIYLNIIELGPDIYGVPRAAQHFFNKNPLELSVREAIYLASILPSPKKRYAFYCRQEVPETWERMLDRLLAIMLKRGHITEEEYRQALASRIVFDASEHPGKDACLGMIRRFQGQ